MIKTQALIKMPLRSIRPGDIFKNALENTNKFSIKSKNIKKKKKIVRSALNTSDTNMTEINEKTMMMVMMMLRMLVMMLVVIIAILM